MLVRENHARVLERSIQRRRLPRDVICLHKRDLYSRKKDLYLRKRDLYLHKRDLTLRSVARASTQAFHTAPPPAVA